MRTRSRANQDQETYEIPAWVPLTDSQHTGSTSKKIIKRSKNKKATVPVEVPVPGM